MLPLLASIPILIVGILMIGLLWPSARAMPIGWLSAAVLAYLFWDMPPLWLLAATLGGAINTLDILIIVFGALLILQIMRKSGGIQGISHSMALISTDRRVQLIIIAWLMGCFLEGAAGFGTPAAVAAPLLVGLGFPPLIAAGATLMADTTPVTFGAVGVPVWGGLAALEEITIWPMMINGEAVSFAEFLFSIGALAAIINFLTGTFIPLAIVALMTKVIGGSFIDGLRVWPVALFGGVVFTLPQVIIANLIGPELPTLLGALIGMAIFIPAVKHGFLVPKHKWEFPPHEKWKPNWEGAIKAGRGEPGGEGKIGPFRAWLPYILLGAILLVARIPVFRLTPILRYWDIGWEQILGTTISRTIQPLYNPGIFPFIFIALLIPLLHKRPFKEVVHAARETVTMIVPASIALFFTLGMVYILMHSGDAADTDSMLIVLARFAAEYTGAVWYLVAPFVGILGTFISGSATVSNIMFGPFQFSTAMQAEVLLVPVLALQTVGAAAGNMICIHNVVAALTTVGLVGKEGIIIKENLPICLLYGLLAGIVAWVLLIIFPGSVMF
ncbi:L-lactate permease [Chitinispirillum alkaliphilum]|nr:L-lactate permease [Chitinispirillum alkaliphilum]